jgi:hypothetical protein
MLIAPKSLGTPVEGLPVYRPVAAEDHEISVWAMLAQQRPYLRSLGSKLRPGHGDGLSKKKTVLPEGLTGRVQVRLAAPAKCWL